MVGAETETYIGIISIITCTVAMLEKILFCHPILNLVSLMLYLFKIMKVTSHTSILQIYIDIEYFLR
jgi:hypothetical protein